MWSPAAICAGGLAGCTSNIDDTAVCFADCCTKLTRLLCVLFVFAADASGQRTKYVGIWALRRVTVP